MEFKTKLEAVKELVGYDHCFLSEEGVRAFCKPFGANPNDVLYEAIDDRSEFKGLNLGEGFKEGDKAKGAGADELAVFLCKFMGVKYMDMYGRGSRLRECCRALEEHLSKS